MSWFDAAGFANLAKSALKEAQKTIDKALDIKEEDQKTVQNHPDESSDFFAAWGLKNEGEPVQHDRSKENKKETSSSIWGSFTGSFFESPKSGEGHSQKGHIQSKSLQSTPVESTQKPSLMSSLSLPEEYTDKELFVSKAGGTSFPGEQSKENVPTQPIVMPINQADIQFTKKDQSLDAEAKELVLTPMDEVSDKKDELTKEQESLSEQENSSTSESGTDQDAERNDSEKSEREKKAICDQESSGSLSSNRLSVASVESDKKSMESVEVLESPSNTDCTTTPESEDNSSSNSISPAAGVKINSESVEILPDSLVTSPSSVEVLGDWKSDTSPYLSPLEPKHLDASPTVDTTDVATPRLEEPDNVRTMNENNSADPSSSDISPYESPMEELRTLNSASCTSSTNTTPSAGVYSSLHPTKNLSIGPIVHKSSPESVEVITDIDELDEASLADDTYTSTSENTVVTVLEGVQPFDQIKSKLEGPIVVGGKMHDSCPDDRPNLSKNFAESQLNLSLDSSKERHRLHLPLEAITTQPIRKPENLENASKKSELSTYDRLINATIEPSEPEYFDTTDANDILTHASKNEKSEQINADSTDQYLILTDSSCEGTLVESSSEDNPTLSCNKTEQKMLDAPLSSSSYVKNMLADAMVEKAEAVDPETQAAEPPRENSPISSESRSDLVKIGSDQTSGHTSGDELETTTSSDIEIISSPNGDSSSTQSRQSPAKLQLAKSSDLLTKTLKTRGHSRELSEISIGSDEANFEIEKLLKRIQEMTEILEARESKLIDVSRMNMDLHEQNNNLKKQLDNFEKTAEQSQNLTQITDEYTQRLSALERKFQQAIRERDSLRKNLEQLKVEAATRLSSQEMCSINAEKDEIIKELRDEGEKLSKQQLQHSTIIKKLRAKEKENDATITNLREQIDEHNSELERLKRSLHAKEEVERTQIEAVHTLTARTKKQEKEIMSLQEKLDNALHKMDAYKRSLDAAKIELAENKKILITTETELKNAVSNAGESCQLFAQVEDLKMKLRQSDEAHAKKEEFLKHENAELLKRLEAAETRSEELSESVSMATKPLLRQLEQLQANLLYKTNGFLKQEKALSEKNSELQSKLENLLEMDRSLKEENVALRSKVSQLESKLSSKETEKTVLQQQYEKLIKETEELKELKIQQQQKIEALEQSHSNQVKELQREISALENQLAVEKAATDAEKRKNNAILEQQQSIDEELRLSPTPSIGRESVSSLNSIWPVLGDSIPDTSSTRYGMLYDSIRAGPSTSVYENLQAQLKQRDGEIQQLQWELSRRNIERDTLNTELAALTLKVEEVNNKATEAQALNESLAVIQTQYDALLQMYGEKMEENEELRLDLEDVKEMYKTQIDQLLKRDT